MATKYWRESTGSDTTGDGSSGNPYKTLQKAITEAGAGGEVRHIGEALVAISVSGLWTNDSTSVVFAGNLLAEIPVGTWIRPTVAAHDNSPPNYVSSVAFAGSTTVTLANKWFGTTGTYASEKLPTADVFTGNSIAPSNGQTFDFGYNSSGAQPVGFVSVLVPSTNNYILLRPSTGVSATVKANDRLIFLSTTSVTNNGLSVISNGSLRVVGRLISGSYSSSYHAKSFYPWGGFVFCDSLLQGQGQSIYHKGGPNLVFIDEVVAHQSTVSGETSSYLVVVGSLTERGANTSSMLKSTRIKVGEATITDNTSAISLSTGVGAIEIGKLTTSASMTYGTKVRIGGPAALWRWASAQGTTDKVEGKEGSPDLAWRMDPNSTLYPHVDDSFVTPVKSTGQAVVLTFDCYYSGTPADAPPCEIHLLDPNGLTVQTYTFTPANGTTWSDSTLQTITFSGTTAQLGTLRWAFYVWDNAAGDAILYLDNLKVSVGGTTDLSDMDTGEGLYYGLDGPLADIPVTGGSGGGMLIPELSGVQ